MTNDDKAMAVGAARDDLAPLVRELGRLRGRLRSLYAVYGVTRVLGIAAALALLTFALDRALDLPRGVRLVLFSTSAATLVFAAYRWLAFPLTRRFSDVDLARAVEDRFPELEDGVLSALQLAAAAQAPDYPDSRELVAAVVRGARDRVAKIPLARIADRNRVGRAALFAALPVALAVAGAVASPDTTSIWVQRMLALRDVPWPRRTWLEVIPFKSGKNLTWERRGDLVVLNVARGSDLNVVVKANGVVPALVEIVYQSVAEGTGEPGSREVRPMARVGDRDFAHAFVALTRSFRFHVQGGDDRDAIPRFHVNVKTPPKVESIRLDVTPPEYTGEGPSTRADGNLEAPEGTDVELQLTTSLDVKAAAMVTLADGGTRALERVGPRRFRTRFTVERTTPYTVTLEAEDGLTNQNPVRFYLKSLADAPPKVRLLAPSSVELDGTPEALVPVRADVTDDYGVNRIGLMVRAGRNAAEAEMPLGPVTTPDGVESAGPERRLLASGEIDLRALPGAPAPAVPSAEGPAGALKPGDLLRFTIEAADTRADRAGAPAPNVIRSQEVRVSIISKAELERKLNDWQLRLKEDVKKLVKNQRARLEKLEGVLASVGSPDGPLVKPSASDFPGRADILDLEVAQNRIGSELRRIESDFVRISDLYVYNRVENTTVGERLLRTLLARAREAEKPIDAYKTIIAESASGTYSESELLSKLLSMLSILVDSAETHSPAVAESLTKARSTIDAELRLDFLRNAKDSGQKLLDSLDLLLRKMDEWEDFQEVLQITREILDFQKAIRTRTIEELEERKKTDSAPK